MTNAAGQASVEIFQTRPARGTNNIAIQVIQPQGPEGQRLAVCNGSTLKTWTAADICVRKTGPAAASIGSNVTYRIEVSNPGDSLAQDVVLTDEVPDNFTYLGSTPAAEIAGKKLQWRVGQLAPRQSRAVELSFRAVQQGSVANCAEVVAAGGLRASDCVTTTVTSPTIDVDIRGPAEAAVGNSVTFEIVVFNHGQAPATGLTIKDRFDPGLEHAAGRIPIERALNDLAPGHEISLKVTFRVAQAGRLCHTVQILSAGRIVATRDGCITGVESPGGRTGPPAFPPAAERSGLSVTKTGPARATVGQSVEFTISVANTGQQSLSDVKVVDHADAGLEAETPANAVKNWTGDLEWTIPSLPPSRYTEIHVKYRCRTAAARLNLRTSATSKEGARGEADASIEVRQEARPPAAAQTGLSVTVTGLHNAVIAGETVKYFVRVKNNGLTPESHLVLAATVPAAMAMDPLGTSGPAKYTYNNHVVTFSPVETIRPGESLTYLIQVRAPQPGVFHFGVDLSSRGLAEPLHADETTEVLQPPTPVR